jgi:hypothetical protein
MKFVSLGRDLAHEVTPSSSRISTSERLVEGQRAARFNGPRPLNVGSCLFQCQLPIIRQTVEVPRAFKLPRYGVRGISSCLVASCLSTDSQERPEVLIGPVQTCLQVRGSSPFDSEKHQEQ